MKLNDKKLMMEEKICNNRCYECLENKNIGKYKIDQ